MVTPLQIIGHKNSGKTTVIEDFLTLLKQRQQSVCVLKHDPHQAQMDHPGTDTDKFTTAGAQTAVLVTQSSCDESPESATSTASQDTSTNLR